MKQSELFSRKLTVQGRRQTCKHFRRKSTLEGKAGATAVIWEEDSEGAERGVDRYQEKSVYPESSRAAGEGGEREHRKLRSNMDWHYRVRLLLWEAAVNMPTHTTHTTTDLSHLRILQIADTMKWYSETQFWILMHQLITFKSCVSPPSSWKVISTLQVQSIKIYGLWCQVCWIKSLFMICIRSHLSHCLLFGEIHPAKNEKLRKSQLAG